MPESGLSGRPAKTLGVIAPQVRILLAPLMCDQLYIEEPETHVWCVKQLQDLGLTIPDDTCDPGDEEFCFCVADVDSILKANNIEYEYDVCGVYTVKHI